MIPIAQRQLEPETFQGNLDTFSPNLSHNDGEMTFLHPRRQGSRKGDSVKLL